MDKKEAQPVAEAVALALKGVAGLPNLSNLATETADAIYGQFGSFPSIDRVSVATVFGLIGAVDSRACMEAYVMGVPVEDLESTVLNALSYLIVSDRIFTEEGVGKTLQDSFEQGATEGS